MSAPKKNAKNAPVKREGNKVFVPRKPQPKPDILSIIKDEDEALALVERKGFYEDESLMRKDCVISAVDFIEDKIQNVRLLLHENGAWATEPIVVDRENFARITLV